MAEPVLENGWRTYRFDQMATIVNDRIDDPSKADVEYYVGLEHLESGSLAIRRWGSPSDVEATKLRFRVGDIIFGRRRVYQRKLAVAQFDGICSAHAMVLRAKPEVALPAFLPFFMQSDLFMERAMEISVGSLSPTINWSTLAKQEFALPPLEAQPRIVQLLDAARGLVDAYDHQLSSLLVLRDSLEASILAGGTAHVQAVGIESNIESVVLPSGWNLVAASTICSAPITSGITPRSGEDDPDPECPFIKVRDLTFDGHLNFGADGSRLNRHAFDETKSLHVVPGDLLTNIVGPPLGKVSVVPASIPEALINQAIVRFRPVDPEIGTWLLAYLMSPWAKRWLFVRSKKTSGQRNINATTCSVLPVPMPPEPQRAALVARMQQVRDAIRDVRERALHARGLLSGLRTEVLSQ
jgi:type I restriction enzyme, S subunit